MTQWIWEGLEYCQKPSWELTYIPPKGTFEDDVPFPKVGWVTFLEGNWVGTAAQLDLDTQRMVKMLPDPIQSKSVCLALLNPMVLSFHMSFLVRRRVMMLMMLLQKTVTCQRSMRSLLHVQKDVESGDEVLEDNMHVDWRLSTLPGMSDVWHPIVQHVEFFV